MPSSPSFSFPLQLSASNLNPAGMDPGGPTARDPTSEDPTARESEMLTAAGEPTTKDPAVKVPLVFPLLAHAALQMSLCPKMPKSS